MIEKGPFKPITEADKAYPFNVWLSGMQEWKVEEPDSYEDWKSRYVKSEHSLSAKERFGNFIKRKQPLQELDSIGLDFLGTTPQHEIVEDPVYEMMLRQETNPLAFGRWKNKLFQEEYTPTLSQRVNGIRGENTDWDEYFGFKDPAPQDENWGRSAYDLYPRFRRFNLAFDRLKSHVDKYPNWAKSTIIGAATLFVLGVLSNKDDSQMIGVLTLFGACGGYLIGSEEENHRKYKQSHPNEPTS